jgi:hypothetical protein
MNRSFNDLTDKPLSDDMSPARGRGWMGLTAGVVFYCVMAVTGIDWGLPSRVDDDLLFGGGAAWRGEQIHQLTDVGARNDRTIGADVDLNPLADTSTPILLTGNDSDVASILLRYRLYTHQPDEMISMMALAGMNPGSLSFDPRLYQYGGLFIYPVGGLIGLAGSVGLVDFTSDLVHYLDHPSAFGRFYIVARAYSATWGLIGLILVYMIARRVGGRGAATLSVLMYTMMPVVVCMSHEAKPHLPGAVLMLAAVWSAIVSVEDGRRRWIHLTAVLCGAATGMVLSSAPIVILIPLALWMRCIRGWSLLRDCVAGGVIAVGTYAVTNPYVVINLFVNREVLASNFGNSTAMYAIGRPLDGVWRMMVLTGEGTTWPVMLLGVVAGMVAVFRRQRIAWVLMVPAGVFVVQFAMIGAGKPAEYGRFGVFADVILAIGAACLLRAGMSDHDRWWRRVATAVMLAVLATRGGAYLTNFVIDSGDRHTRRMAGERLLGEFSTESEICVAADPAPYCCPPLDFSQRRVVKLPDSDEEWKSDDATRNCVYAIPLDSPDWDDIGGRYFWWLRDPSIRPPVTPISWANKPIAIESSHAQVIE